MAKAPEAKKERKLTVKEAELRFLLSELSEIFDDLTKPQIRSLAKMNMITDRTERGQAIEYFWAAYYANA